MAYDFMSRRVQKNVFEWQTDHWSLITEHLFTYDGWNLIREHTTGSTTSTEYYVWGLDLSGTLQGAGGIGGLLSKTNNLTFKTFLYTFDANGNVGQLVDSSTGAIAAHYEYDPFGKLLVATGSEADNNIFRFSTKYVDTETELYYYGYRYYSPELGRWPTRDPIGEIGGANRYGFVWNNPINAVDPYGLLQELTVALTAAGRGGGGFDGYGYHVAGENRQPFTTGTDVINALREWTQTQGEGFSRDKCTCIKNLYVFSHAWGYQSKWGKRHGGGFYSDGVGGGPSESGFYGKKSLYDHDEARSLDDLQADINTGYVRFCNTCMITLTGCRVASTGNFASDLTRMTGCTVRAAAGGCNSETAPQFSSAPGVFAEGEEETPCEGGGVPWQEFIPITIIDPQTGQPQVIVTVRDIGGCLILW